MAKKKHETIDITPQWKSLVPLFVIWLESGTTSQRKCAREHIEQLATLADILLEHHKHGGLTCKCGKQFEL